MQTTHLSISHTHSQTQLPYDWTKDCPQFKDIRINGKEKEELKRSKRGRRTKMRLRNTPVTPSL